MDRFLHPNIFTRESNLSCFSRKHSNQLKKIITLSLFAVIGLASYVLAGDTGKLAGKVTDKETGEPLIGANILILSKWAKGRAVK